jgi:hypothetical protein
VAGIVLARGRRAILGRSKEYIVFAARRRCSGWLGTSGVRVRDVQAGMEAGRAGMAGRVDKDDVFGLRRPGVFDATGTFVVMVEVGMVGMVGMMSPTGVEGLLAAWVPTERNCVSPCFLVTPDHRS